MKHKKIIRWNVFTIGIVAIGLTGIAISAPHNVCISSSSNVNSASSVDPIKFDNLIDTKTKFASSAYITDDEYVPSWYTSVYEGVFTVQRMPQAPSQWPKLFIPKEATRIGSLGERSTSQTDLTHSWFYGITEIDFEEGSRCTTIDTDAFANFVNLKNIVNLPPNIKYVNAGAFYNTWSLQNVDISFLKNLTYINEYTFENTGINFGNITLDSKLILLEKFAFYGANIKSIDLSQTRLTDISPNAFSYSSIENIIFPESLTFVGDMAFCGCPFLAKVDFGRKMNAIGSAAFSTCKSLESVSFRYDADLSQAIKLGYKAFESCDKLQHGDVSFINLNIFHNVQNCLQEGGWVDIDPCVLGLIYGEDDLFNIDANGTLIGLKDHTNFDLGICHHLFIPQSVKVIDVNAFIDGFGGSVFSKTNCKYGIDAYFAGDNACTEIKESAFAGNDAITSIRLPNTIQTIKNNAFANCTSLAYIGLSTSISSIEDLAFYNCSGITNINFDHNNYYSEVKIGPNAMAICNNSLLDANRSWTNKTVVVGGLACGDVDFTNVNTCESIISHAFNHCSSITGLTIGSNISNIGQSAFRGCSSLKRVNLSAASELNSISTLAFADDTHLENVVLSKNIQKLGDSTFQNCTNLVKVETELCVNLNIIGTSCFADCISLIQFVCPRSVTYIGSYAFTGCSSLRYVTLLSDYFDELGANIFANCISLEKDGSYLMFVNIEDPNILEGVISPAGIFDAIIPYQVYISDITNVNDWARILKLPTEVFYQFS